MRACQLLTFPWSVPASLDSARISIVLRSPFCGGPAQAFALRRASRRCAKLSREAQLSSWRTLQSGAAELGLGLRRRTHADDLGVLTTKVEATAAVAIDLQAKAAALPPCFQPLHEPAPPLLCFQLLIPRAPPHRLAVASALQCHGNA